MHVPTVPPAKHEARAPYTRAEARAAQQWHERVLPVHPADRGADGAPAPRAQLRGWANTWCVEHAHNVVAECRCTYQAVKIAILKGTQKVNIEPLFTKREIWSVSVR